MTKETRCRYLDIIDNYILKALPLGSYQNNVQIPYGKCN